MKKFLVLCSAAIFAGGIPALSVAQSDAAKAKSAEAKKDAKKGGGARPEPIKGSFKAKDTQIVIGKGETKR